MPCLLSTWRLTIVFQQYGTLIVLIYDIICDRLSLFLEKIVCPKYQWHGIIYTNQFGFSWTSSVDLLLYQCWVHRSFTQHHGHASLTTHLCALQMMHQPTILHQIHHQLLGPGVYFWFLWGISHICWVSSSPVWLAMKCKCIRMLWQFVYLVVPFYTSTIAAQLYDVMSQPGLCQVTLIPVQCHMNDKRLGLMLFLSCWMAPQQVPVWCNAASWRIPFLCSPQHWHPHEISSGHPCATQ